ncbi:MAG: sugar phosphate isomerase/epimerase [Armatimonadetes bacterium]|nr:sugar phosphate isomerase/epimerase [Armatimonadota bacterium]
MTSKFTRRAFLQSAALGVAGATLGSSGSAFALADNNDYGPFRMGIQSYSLRAFKTDEALKMTQKLGLKYWEAFPGHFKMTHDPIIIREYKNLLKKYNINLVTYGVVDFSTNEEDARYKFEFARLMGIKVLSAYPTLDSFSLLNTLVEEYKINLAIHNHGPGDNLYDLISKEEKALQTADDRIGACIDTGHYLRSNEDPASAASRFGKRVYGVHLKDVKDLANGGKEFTEIGKGSLKTVELLKTLNANQFKGILSIEYEEHENAPMPYIEECLKGTREAIKAAIKR